MPGDVRSQKTKAVAAVLVALHIALLAAYTLPEVLVSEKLRILGQWYARPLFHQQWRLFAPDPPTCSCTLEWHNGDGDWRSVATKGMHYLERRMVHNHCLWLAEDFFGAERLARKGLLRLARPDEAAVPRFRIVERCVTDPAAPATRTERIIPLYGP